jgi:BON domain
MIVGLKRISSAFALLALSTSAALAQETINANQLTADAVAATLRSSKSLAGQRIEIQTREGLVTLSGTVAIPAQKAEILARARRVVGVRGVVDQLRVLNEQAIQTVQYESNPALAFRQGPVTGAPISGAGILGGATGYQGVPTGAPATTGIVSDGGPVPEGRAGMPGATQAYQPGYPNYAWPSYAPYPNFSAVGYPTAYPWQAWPNIGPFYPYPEVPLDWRAVTLRWDDGIWWLDFKKHYTRPFFTPYPFGIFAY